MMKIIILIVTILHISGMGFANPPTELNVRSETIHVKIEGLACPFCVYGVEKKLKKIEGIEDVDVNLKEGLITLKIQSGAEVSDKEIQKAIKESGFKASHIHRGSENSREQGDSD